MVHIVFKALDKLKNYIIEVTYLNCLPTVVRLNTLTYYISSPIKGKIFQQLEEFKLYYKDDFYTEKFYLPLCGKQEEWCVLKKQMDTDGKEYS